MKTSKLKSTFRFLIYLVAVFAAVLFLNACSHTEPKASTNPQTLTQLSKEELIAIIQYQNKQLESLEPRGSDSTSKVPVVPVPLAGESKANPVTITKVQPDHLKTSGSFEERFKDGVILLKQNNSAEAAVLFANLTENYPSHPLVSSAAFYLGEAYFHQKDYQVAKEEYTKYISRYPYSPHISYALKRLQACASQLGDSSLATKSQKLLKQLFPYSMASIKPSEEGLSP
jgi:TolA-binding protein